MLLYGAGPGLGPILQGGPGLFLLGRAQRAILAVEMPEPGPGCLIGQVLVVVGLAVATTLALRVASVLVIL